MAARKRPAKKWPALHPNLCAIRQYTADRKPAGRCYRTLKMLEDGTKICSLHWDVTKAQASYVERGLLTRDYDLRETQKESLLHGITECEGLEIHAEHPCWFLLNELIREGWVVASSPRGPGGAWRRVTLKEDKS